MMTAQQPRPDFVIIGAMKCGTTSLFRWLDAHPDTCLPRVKEPHWFSHPHNMPGGLDGYRGLFAEAPPGVITGEASTVYADPRFAADAAARMALVVPRARLVMLVRDRAARTLSHYRHAVRAGREDRSVAEAVTPDSEYVRRSLYTQGLAPYLDHFPADQILVGSLEALGRDDRLWEAVLGHLGLCRIPRPGGRHNVGAELDAVPGWLHRVAARRRFLLAHVPSDVRTAVKRAAGALGDISGTVDADAAAIPADSRERLCADEEQFPCLLRDHAVRTVW